MLVEVNDLSVIVVGRPAFVKDDLPSWKRLCERFRCYFLVDAGDVDDWHAVFSDSASVLAWNTSVYNPVASGIRTALDAADAQPHQAVYITGNPDDLFEAIGTRVGTFQVGADLRDMLPDGWYASVQNAVDALFAIKNGTVYGWIGEARTTCLGSGGTSNGFRAHSQSAREVSESAVVWFLGRYFATTDERHRKHQLSARLLKAKNEEASREVLAHSLASAFPGLYERYHFDVLAHIAPRPSAASDHVGDMVRLAAEFADDENRTSFCNIIDNGALSCVNDYGKQKYAGSFEKRRENVRGAFRANSAVRGKKILLVDDIFTTGATIAEGVRTLKAAGAEAVYGLVVARTQNYATFTPYIASCRRRCGGHYVLRFNSRDGSAFWGCSNFPECEDTLSWREGIFRYNALALREDIVPLYDVSF